MDLTRRRFLKHSQQWLTLAGLGALFPGLTLLPRKSQATSLGLEAVKDDGMPDQFFVLLRTMGGMDCTLGLDPWVMPANADEQDMFIEYRPDEISSVGDFKVAPAARPLLEHAKDCLIVNGVMMRRDAGHDVDNLYMASGAGDGKSATIPIELGLAMGTGPFGVVLNTSPYLAGKAASISSTDDLKSAQDQEKLIEFVEEQLKLGFAQQGTPWDLAQKQLVAGKAAAQKFVEIMKGMQAQYPKIEAEHIAAAAMACGGAAQAEIQPSFQALGLDTHSNHPIVHLKLQTEVWAWVANIFKVYKSIPYGTGSLFDRTTFMVMTEFSRTPALNGGKGKDHNPLTNSVLLAGRGIQGGKVVGKSRLITRKQTASGSPNHIAWPFNYTTGQLATGPEGASFFFPENLIRTVGQAFGDPPLFAAVPHETNLIPGIVKA